MPVIFIEYIYSFCMDSDCLNPKLCLIENSKKQSNCSNI